MKIISENGCEYIDNFSIEVQNQSLETISPFIVCEDSDGETNNNTGQFNLTDKIDEIANQFNISNTETFNFYESLKYLLINF